MNALQIHGHARIQLLKALIVLQGLKRVDAVLAALHVVLECVAEDIMVRVFKFLRRRIQASIL